MKVKRKMVKERNPFVLHLANRPSGPHGKSKKTQRRDDKMALRKEHAPVA